VQALAAARLEEARQADLLEQRAHQLGAFLHRPPGEPFAGIEVEDDPVGVLRVLVVAFQVWNSITLACAAPISAVNESTSIIGSWSGENEGSSSRSSGMRRAPAWRWKTSGPDRPAGARTSETGRLTRCGRISRATSR
jgi:hypothetical protein